jgi:hypothetical protein
VVAGGRGLNVLANGEAAPVVDAGWLFSGGRGLNVLAKGVTVVELVVEGGGG